MTEREGDRERRERESVSERGSEGYETVENRLTATIVILLTKFHSGAPRGENEMGDACSSMVKGRA